ncbi:UTP--glucose-1-phosphate uridylyltransferase [Candidatus Kuenenbacteria bacterium]|nr:UTP--glucose-1-phosphate uridylyltransferase [Candidatus Kuenenbacteria bacterium]
MKQKIRKVVIPVAGFGTRFLPATKAMPKEILPVVDKPIIQFVVEEAVSAGIKDVILVTGWHKRIIEDHFDYPYELEKRLEEAGKQEQLKEIRRIAGMANFIYVRQKGPYGNGTPVLNAKHIIGDEPFLVLWGDELFDAEPSRSKQLLKVWDKYQKPVITGMEPRSKEDAESYGVIYGKTVEDGIWEVKGFEEKPGAKRVKMPFLTSPSGYILTPDIFPILEKQKAGRGGEVWLVDAIRKLSEQKPVYACRLKNTVWCDTGNKLEYIKTIIRFAMKRKEYSSELRKYIKEILNNKN